MAKITLVQPTGGYDLSVINDNFQKIQDEFQDKVLYRDNTSGENNVINNTVDFNGKRAINLAAPGGPTEPLRLADLSLITNPIGATTALLVSVTPSGNISSINVAGAINELDSEKAIKGTNNDITSMTGLNNGGIPLAKVSGAAASGVNNDITSLTALSTVPTIISTAISAGITTAIDSSGPPAGTIIDWPAASAPAGYEACPLVATNVSRVGTYARVFANLGTTWGVGDGSTTFGIPYYPADYVSVQANANVATSSTGTVKAHLHAMNADGRSVAKRFGSDTGIDWASSTSSAEDADYTGSQNTGNTGGTDNLAAGMRMLKCIRV